MEIRIVTVFLVAFVTISRGQKRMLDAAIQWGYGDNNGPEKWPELFPDKCAGMYQSPVDIRPFNTMYNRQLTNFIFYDPPSWMSIFVAHNNGHTIQVDTQGQFLLANGGLKHTYRIVQFHFHWGNANEKGAEHTIYEATAPMEMHIVSWNVDRYSSFTEAARAPDGLAVLGILFRVSHYDNPILEPLIQVIPSIRDPDWNNRVEIPVVSLSEFLPHSPEKYYRYWGSLTTPRCYESVTWTVFKERQTISERQLHAFRQAMTSARMSQEVTGPDTMQSIVIGGNSGEERERLVNNYRPVLPLNGRVIQRSFYKF